MKKKKLNNDFEVSSGNVFADLGLPNPEERLAKAELARQINNLIKQKKLTQSSAAKLLKIDQSKILALSTGRLASFSLEGLFRFLIILGQEITIKVTPKTRSKKKTNINVTLTKIRKKPIIKERPSSLERVTIQAKKRK